MQYREGQPQSPKVCAALYILKELPDLPVQLNQMASQSNSGGMTELYLDSGTYVKSFYTIMVAPSCVTIAPMGVKNRRLHHRIDWGKAVPMIISESFAP